MWPSRGPQWPGAAHTHTLTLPPGHSPRRLPRGQKWEVTVRPGSMEGGISMCGHIPATPGLNPGRDSVEKLESQIPRAGASVSDVRTWGGG